MSSTYYVNDLATTTGTYSREALDANTDGQDYHYSLGATADINTTILSTFNVVVLATGEGEGGQDTATPGAGTAGLEFVTHAGTLDLASIKTHFKAGTTTGGASATAAFTTVISQMIMGTTTAAPDSAATAGTGKTVDVLNTASTSSFDSVIDSMTLTQTAATLDLAGAMYADGKTPGAQSGTQTITLAAGDAMHFTVSISLSATGDLRTGASDGVDSGNALNYVGGTAGVADQIRVRLIATQS